MPRGRGSLSRAFERGYDAMARGYRVTLDASLRVPWLMLLLTLGTMVATVWAFGVVKKGFLPTEDTSIIIVRTEVGAGYFVPGHARAPAAGRRGRTNRSGRALRQFQRRLGRLQSDPQSRLGVRPAQVAKRAAGRGDNLAGTGPVAPQALRHHRHPRLPRTAAESCASAAGAAPRPISTR